MANKDDGAAVFRVTAGGLISIDGEDRNCLVLEGDTDMIREGTRYWGEKVVLMSEAEYCTMLAARDAASARADMFRDMLAARAQTEGGET